MRDDELKDLQDFATAINTRMDALVAHADSLRRLLEQVGATHQAAVTQLAEAQRQGMERVIAAQTEARLRELKARKSRGTRGKGAGSPAATRRPGSQDRGATGDRVAGARSDSRGRAAFERRERTQTA